jgi:hypothetical protein
VTVTAANYNGGTTATIAVPAITQDIADNGTVLVYLSFSSGWRGLPFTFVSGTISRTMVYYYRVGNVTLQLFSNDTDPAAQVYTGSYKIVVISGRPGKTDEPVDYSDYEAVKAYYGLSEADEIELTPVAALEKASR